MGSRQRRTTAPSAVGPRRRRSYCADTQPSRGRATSGEALSAGDLLAARLNSRAGARSRLARVLRDSLIAIVGCAALAFVSLPVGALVLRAATNDERATSRAAPHAQFARSMLEANMAKTRHNALPLMTMSGVVRRASRNQPR